MDEAVAALVREVAEPLIRADGGELEVLRVSGDRIVVRLGGACAGCPGRSYTQAYVLEPLFRSVGLELVVE